MAVRAPAFGEGLAWLNSEPLLLSELRGRYILLDFFTFGCINCLNNLHTVRALHAGYGSDLCVIGIHTGKFTHEKELDALNKALLREEIDFAVVNDPEHIIADAYAVKGWPTTILIDNRGYIVHHASGEQKLTEWRGRFSSCGLQAKVERKALEVREHKLAFPQKVLAVPEFLAVANTGSDEVWLSDYEGVVHTVIAVERPMGMAYGDGRLYICESGAGKVISYTLQSGQKETLIEGLRNPLDVAVAGNRLFVAVAGSHLLNAYDLKEETLLVSSYGNRFEALRDGDAQNCQLAQPSGLAMMDETLYFVDAESSSLRKLEQGVVTTLLGEGLFTYGDSDSGDILLQHPQGIAPGIIGDGCGGGRLFIADTFNNKVKAYFPDDNSMRTLVEGLDEPGGISKKGCTLYIANTNANEVVVFDLPEMQGRVMRFAVSEDDVNVV